MNLILKPAKYFLLGLLIAWLLAIGWRNVLAENGGYMTPSYVTEEKVKQILDEQKKDPACITKGNEKRLAPQCPKTLLEDTLMCARCHTFPSWKVKEAKPDEVLDYPNTRLRIRNEMAFYTMRSVIDESEIETLSDTLDYLKYQHPEVTTLKFDILSGGGSMFDGWQLISMLERKKGNLKIQTEVQGFAASAAFLLFLAGEERATYDYAILMWHEVWTFRMFSLDTVSSSEEKARMMRFFQNNAHTFILSKAKSDKLDAKKLNERVAGEKQYWMTGKEALDIGFATKLL